MSNYIEAEFEILEQKPIEAIFEIQAVVSADGIVEDLNNEINRAKQAENQLQGQINGITADIDDISEELTTKADKSNTYTKNEVDIKIATVEVDAYTKQETNELLATKQPKGDYVTTTKLNTEVSKLATKSSLNLTNNNLDALTGEVENIAGELDSKADKSEIPTKTSDLENDSNFTTEQEVAQMIASIPQFEVKIVQELPQTGEAMVLYLVPKDGEAPDVYFEYIWLATSQSFELIGSTVVDLSDYYTKGETNTLLNTKQPVGDYATNTALTNGLATKQNTISDLSTIRAQASNSVQYGVATSGGLYLRTHGELHTDGVVIPFIYNDMAFFNQKGGTLTFARRTEDGEFEEYTQSDADNIINGKPDYCMPNPIGYYEFQITCTNLNKARSFNYSNMCYIDFGNPSMRADRIKIEYKLSGGDWIVAKDITNGASSYYTSIDGTYSGIVALRFTLRPYNRTSQYNFRIAQIGLINYNSDGASATYLSRSGGTLYGSVSFARGGLTGYQKTPTITKASNNQSGIIQYDDGRMEQWGLATSSTTGETEFTMNNSFVDTNFQVFIEPRQAGDLVHYAIPSAKNKFKARIQNTSGAYMTCQFQWRAYGFWK